MVITAGLGSVDDYPIYVKAGAQEMFCGYVPDWWTEKYGIYMPINRREVLYYNVQIGSRSEMEILRDMIQMYHVPVSIAVNALYYLPEQYPLLLRYIEECRELGFSSFIIADPALIWYLHREGILDKISVSVSGEFSEMNRELMRELEDLGVKRTIFHRKMTISEMAACVRCSRGRISEYEAFALNENCHFHGAYCSSLHCDELLHACRLPYRLSGRDGEHFGEEENSGEIDDFREDICIGEDISTEEGRIGESGCGFCALWDLKHAGITHLKVVGRGNYSEDMERDIRGLHRALEILEGASSREEYIAEMKRCIFPEGCSGSCYYREEE